MSAPDHYTHGKIQPLEVIEDWGLGFHLGNVLKYIGRAGHKGDALDDLRKARTYLDREISNRAAQVVVRELVDLEPNEPGAAWVRHGCGDMWCRVHECHTHDPGCDCPGIEEWDCDPYTDGGPDA